MPTYTSNGEIDEFVEDLLRIAMDSDDDEEVDELPYLEIPSLEKE